MTESLFVFAAFARLSRRIQALSALAAVVGLGLVVATFHLVYNQALEGLRQDVHTSAQLRASALQSEIDKQRAVPAVLAADSDVRAALESPDPVRLNGISAKLENLRHETHGAVIYLLDKKGVAVAASNWTQPESFVGSSYGFRRYFTDAVRQTEAAEFALGTVSHRPGLFLSHSVVADRHVIGVVVVKLEFDALETDWSRLRDTAFVTNSDHKVIVTAHDAWRFKSPPVAAPDQVSQALDIKGMNGWQLHVYRSAEAARAAGLAASAILLLLEVLLAGAIVWTLRRRQNLRLKAQSDQAYLTRLERDVGERTHALRYANDKLSEEIEERRNAQARLNALQADLVQANKLAQLGQITAGVAHEINQPLATIRALADNALSGLKPAGIKANLETIVRMSDRIGHITGELRAFSRKATGESQPTSLSEAVEGSILLTHSRLKSHKVRFQRPKIDAGLRVWGERVRLEQVLVNLLQNAFEAVETAANPSVTLRLEDQEDIVRLIVEDNGPGLPDAIKTALFIPFKTTKPKGLGLGLVIARDIVSDFGGELMADIDVTIGARFIVSLRKAST
ncbi:sensor histidine kinase [Asticcacaulis sp. 201]|uniref:sensor histidine kinase n=1 Tax=Asticcacaulis sp. 201 TaxID=3028787 RepID=UPI002916FF16|nr:ATP-binding protein [Asticcacaulis sp. 201]MDV6330914.1 ATP-binding protein [Asticcacaulis sp. 201]